MNAQNISTLKIHKLSKEQYDRELQAGRIDPNALYLTPDDEDKFATKEYVDSKPGKNLEGTTQIYYDLGEGDDYYFDTQTEAVSGKNAEIFNTYEDDEEYEVYKNIAIGNYSHAEGSSTCAIGDFSHAEGYSTTAYGYNSHAEGENAETIGYSSHAEGSGTLAVGYASHAEGYATCAEADMSHTEGYLSSAEGYYSHAEGHRTEASGDGSHTEGSYSKSKGINSHAEGYSSEAFGEASHAEGGSRDIEGNRIKSHKVNGTDSFYIDGTVANGIQSHAEGTLTYAGGYSSHAEGTSTVASGDYGSHAEGYNTIASGEASHAEGGSTTASANYSHSEGTETTASGKASHAEGGNYDSSGKKRLSGRTITLPDNSTVTIKSSTATGIQSHAEGTLTYASGYSSHAEGEITTASGSRSHAEGLQTTASGSSSHAEGVRATASGAVSHAEGLDTTASGSYSHAEGNGTIASGEASHAEGNGTIAEGFYSHAEGYDTKAISSYQHVQGKTNIPDEENKYAHIVGNGRGTKLSNAHTLDWNGNAWFAGDVYVGSSFGTNQDEGSKKLAIDDDYKNAILLDGEGLKNTSGENITENIKTLISKEPFVIEADVYLGPEYDYKPMLVNSNITYTEVNEAYQAGRNIQLLVHIEDREETLYLGSNDLQDNLFAGRFVGSGSMAMVVIRNGIMTGSSLFEPNYFEYMQGAEADWDGRGGLVPTPLAGDQNKFLKGDGTWADILTNNQTIILREW